MSRKKRPSRYRCLKALAPSLLSLVIFWASGVMLKAGCGQLLRRGLECNVALPSPVYLVLGAMFFGGLAVFGYQAYRDWARGDFRRG